MADVVSIRTYAGAFVALLALLALTTAADFIDLGQWAVPVALTIAAAKALLILLFFMHLKTARGVMRIVAAAGVFWLFVMFLLTFADYLTRPMVWWPVFR